MGQTAALLPDALCARFTVDAEVERTGLARAYRARRVEGGALVELHALDRLRPGVTPEGAWSSLSALPAVSHVYLARTLELLALPAGPWVVCPTTSGVAFGAWLDEQGTRGAAARFEAARPVIDQAAQALAALHRAGRSHGAFDLSCVRVETRGSAPVARIEGHGWSTAVLPPAGWVLAPDDDPVRADLHAFARATLTALLGRPVPAEGDLDAWLSTLPVTPDAELRAALLACLSPARPDAPADLPALRERLRRASWTPVERALPPPPTARRDVPPPADPPRAPSAATASRVAWSVPVAPSSSPMSAPSPSPSPSPPRPAPAMPALALDDEATVHDPSAPPAVDDDEATAVPDGRWADAAHGGVRTRAGTLLADDPWRAPSRARVSTVGLDALAADALLAQAAEHTLAAPRRASMPAPTPSMPTPAPTPSMPAPAPPPSMPTPAPPLWAGSVSGAWMPPPAEPTQPAVAAGTVVRVEAPRDQGVRVVAVTLAVMLAVAAACWWWFGG